MKIVYCTDTICYPGGIQTVTIHKANALADVDGNEVWIVVADGKRKAIAQVSAKVHVVDLDINYYKDDWKSSIHVTQAIVFKRKIHKKRLKQLFKQILPDVVVSTGTSEKYFLPSIHVSSNPVFIRELHFLKLYRRYAADNLYSKFTAILGNWIDFGNYINRYDRIVLLTNEDWEGNWRKSARCCVIPDIVVIQGHTASALTNKIVIAAGRLVDQKNFMSLINAWKTVHEHYPEWELQIWGDGKQKGTLEQQVKNLHLESSVLLKGYTEDVPDKMLNASIFVLSSKYEGFGLVIAEAMSCGLPVVSYACPCGPKDIITDKKDGFLVPVGDEKMLADRICYLIKHEDIRKLMGANAVEKSKNYSAEKIIPQWMALFNELLDKKKS